MRYYASRISENLARMPNGFLLCRNVPIARTGWQKYRGSEIGLDGDVEVDVYRSQEEVFDPATIASFEGMTFTDGHPAEFVGPANDNSYHRGHVQNVRRGERDIESGEEPLIADIIVKDLIVINKIENGIRDISCGYDCEYMPTDDGQYEQKKIRGNHIALVPSGRAGDKVRIKDEKIEDKEVYFMDWKKFLIGLGLKTYAKDADPEKLAEAAAAAKEEEEPVKKKEEDDRYRDDKRSKDDDRGRDDRKLKDDRKSRDDDRIRDDDRGRDRKFRDDDDRVRDDDDRVRDDDRKSRDWRSHATDDPISRLCDLLQKAMGIGEDDDDDRIRDDDDRVRDDDRSKDDDRSRDADLVDPVETMKGNEIPKNPIPGADKALDALRAMKPLVAKSRDRALIRQYNDAVSSLKPRSSSGVKDGYGKLLRLRKPDNVRDAEDKMRMGKATDAQSVSANFVNVASQFHRKNVAEVEIKREGGK